MKILNNKIKIVIWDLDNTFWLGTISEGGIVTPPKNVAIVKELTRRGIINSISSKNNFKVVKRELEALQVKEVCKAGIGIAKREVVVDPGLVHVIEILGGVAAGKREIV